MTIIRWRFERINDQTSTKFLCALKKVVRQTSTLLSHLTVDRDWNNWSLRSQTLYLVSYCSSRTGLNKIKILTSLNSKRKDLRIAVYRPMQSTYVRIDLRNVWNELTLASTVSYDAYWFLVCPVSSTWQDHHKKLVILTTAQKENNRYLSELFVVSRPLFRYLSKLYYVELFIQSLNSK